MRFNAIKIGTARLVQALLMGAYRVAVASGSLSTRWGRAAFEWAYMIYKNRLEATTVDGLRTVITPGTSVIDVGANIGFFTLRFGHWITGSAKVFALEPEPANFHRLTRRIARAGLIDRVEAIRAAAAETSGELRLAVDPVHPGNHKLATSGIPVQSIAIDALMAKHDWPRVALLKIDVQGAEQRVLAGAAETLRRFRPAVFIEIDRDSDGNALLQQIIDLGYQPHVLRRSSPPEAVTPERVRQLVAIRGYHDFLFLSAGSTDDLVLR
ncbi:MAG: FkbM family methyltransferase [Chloroflexi bacterium]|nr:FkbM family methyltransferase [Chloroflexota bacterium]